MRRVTFFTSSLVRSRYLSVFYYPFVVVYSIFIRFLLPTTLVIVYSATGRLCVCVCVRVWMTTFEPKYLAL